MVATTLHSAIAIDPVYRMIEAWRDWKPISTQAELRIEGSDDQGNR